MLNWAAAYYGGGPRTLEAGVLPTGHGTASTESLAELIARADAQTEAQRVLVASYWLQTHGEEDQLDAQRVNCELKHIGYRAGNITRAFDRLMGERPQLAVQTKKSGTTKQARKKYRLTVERQREVERMLGTDR